MANRGDLFEVIFAAAVAARFEKRYRNIQNTPRTRLNQTVASSYQLPRISNNDTIRVLRQIVPLINSGQRWKTSIQDVIQIGETEIFDHIRVRVNVPREAAIHFSRSAPNFRTEMDMISHTTRLANAHSTLNSRAKQIAINARTDVVVIDAAGTLDQRNTKADVKVKIRSEGKTQRGYADFSCKVPGGEQFHQVSGGQYSRFEELFGQMGLRLNDSTYNKYIQSFNRYLSEDIFDRRFAERSAIYQAKIPTHLKNNAARVYIDAARQIKSAFVGNTPLKDSILEYIYNGFTRGIDTELVKLTGSSSRVRGFKTQLLNPEFLSNNMKNRIYTVKFVRSASRPGDPPGAGRSPQIILRSVVDVGGSQREMDIFIIRYKWENPSGNVGGRKMYRIYPRHYLETGEGFFYL